MNAASCILVCVLGGCVRSVHTDEYECFVCACVYVTLRTVMRNVNMLCSALLLSTVLG